MIFSETATQSITEAPATPVERGLLREKIPDRPRAEKGRLHFLALLCLLVACLGANWFAYQYLLVPQSQNFAPAWNGAQWVQAVDDSGPGLSSAYFRYVTDLKTVPDNAFVTIAADQVFQLYVNGILVGANNTDMGNFPRAYIYEVTASIVPGINVLAVRVSNMDNQIPLLRASFGTVIAGMISYNGTGNGTGWQATAQSALVFPAYDTATTTTTDWTNPTFDASSWLAVSVAQPPSITPLLSANPVLYEQPISTNWVSSGIGRNAYFVRQLSLPAGTTHVWLRMVATGTATVFLNGNHLITWNYQPSTISYTTKSQGKAVVKHRHVLVLGVYNVSPYLHSGENSIAVYMTLPAVSGLNSGYSNENAQLLLDVLASDGQGHMTWLPTNDGWHISQSAASGWEDASAQTLNWQTAVSIGPPDGFGVVYSSKSQLISKGQQGVQVVPFTMTFAVLALSVGTVLGLWLLVSLLFMCRYYSSRRAALEVTSLAYLPALACEGLLVVLAREPQMPQPFPCTSLWAAVLLALVGCGYFLLWLHARSKPGPATGGFTAWLSACISSLTLGIKPLLQKTKKSVPSKGMRLASWLSKHWPVLLILVLAAPLVCYGLGYEPYWQDELVSYLVAKSIMVNGLPLLPSGFVYPKGELYSYILALSMKIFGEQNGMPRLVSVIEYLITIPLLYRVGCYFFDRRVALLATAMLAFSPHEIIWGHQVRMYQQAQMFTLLSVYLFYKAVQERQRIRLIYISMGVLLLTYLSHEETFIILPALLICVLVASWGLRDPKHRLPEVLYQKHWWIAAVLGVSVIGIQLTIVHITHPPTLGTDTTLRPEVQFTTDNISYYFNLLFFPTANEPAFSGTFVTGVSNTIVLNSLLAILGCGMAWRSRNLRIVYCTLFLIIGFLTLVFIFTMQADRYFYPLVPFYILMGAYALVTMVRSVWRFACVRSSSALVAGGAGRQEVARIYRDQPAGLLAREKSASFPLRILIGMAAILTCGSVLILPVLPLNSYNLFVSRVAGLPYYHHFGDYQDVQQYMQGHLQKGDVVISIIPDTVVLYYVGRSDYFFSISHALFLFERDGHIVDTYTGKIALLHESDLQAVLAQHGRIWIISGNNSYQRNVLKRFVIPPEFHIVFEGTESIIYLRGG